MYLTGGLIMVYNMWMTVKGQPARAVAYAGVPAE
jgi:cbb3-type cytochrome oxidase subunit 1